MEVLHDQNDKKGIFYVEVDGARKAEMTYTWGGSSKMIIDHTEVDDSLRGKKVGYLLVEKAVEFARENQIKILPLCPFANYVMEKNTDYKDVIF
jgi:predicted GNAT family acetyltransferase